MGMRSLLINSSMRFTMNREKIRLLGGSCCNPTGGKATGC